MTDRLTLTAPPVIYLQVSDDKDDRNIEFPADAFTYEVTWCRDSVLEAEVKYVRADLAAATSMAVATPSIGKWMDAERGEIDVNPQMAPADMWRVLTWALSEMDTLRKR